MNKERPFILGKVIGILLAALCIYGVFASWQKDVKVEEAMIAESRQSYAEENGMIVVGSKLIKMWETSRSSCFSRVGYEEDEEILVVEFRDSGAQYVYYDVPETEWNGFYNDVSLGGYYNKYIKGNYKCERLD